MKKKFSVWITIAEIWCQYQRTKERILHFTVMTKEKWMVCSCTLWAEAQVSPRLFVSQCDPQSTAFHSGPPFVPICRNKDDLESHSKSGGGAWQQQSPTQVVRGRCLWVSSWEPVWPQMLRKLVQIWVQLLPVRNLLLLLQQLLRRRRGHHVD